MPVKILFLADAQSIHTIRWVKALSERGFSIILFSLQSYNESTFTNMSNVEVCSDNKHVPKHHVQKIKYLSVIKQIKSLLTRHKPDILHAHYASSYGLLGALTGFHPFIISVWGSDVFKFPNKSSLHRKLLKYNLSKADKVLSTSRAMAVETMKYTTKHVEITPFGIDTEFFQKKTNTETSVFKVGTVKALEEVYGIDILIQAFAELLKRTPNKTSKLLIAGYGSKKAEYEQLVEKLRIGQSVDFCGRVEHSKVPEFLNKLDVFAAISREESFGVAVIEASSCELPVIVSNVGGLPEVAEHTKTGIVVSTEDVIAITDAMELLLKSPELRLKMGKEGRKKVIAEYNWSENVSRVCLIYLNLLTEKH